MKRLSGNYLSPETDILDINVEGILCGSIPSSIEDWQPGGSGDLNAD